MTDQFEPIPSPAAMLLPAGRQLRNAREALDLTPEQVALQLKLSVRQITAIEQEAFDELPSNLFIRGFVRNYARLVNIDVEPLLAYLLEALPNEPEHTTLLDTSVASGVALPKSTKNKFRLSPSGLMIFLGLILGVAAVVWFLQQPANPELALPEVDTPPVVDLPAASAVETSAILQSASPVAVLASVASAVKVSVATASPAAAIAASAAAAVSSDAIKITSSTDSWVQIVDANGNKVLSEIIRPGIERTVGGTPPFAVKVGNAPKTQLYFHGQSVDLSPYLKPGSDVVNMELK